MNNTDNTSRRWINEAGMELTRHGTVSFPLAQYNLMITCESVVWHWHEEFEIGIVTEGSLHVWIGETEKVLNKGEGFFVGSGVLHAMRNSAEAKRCGMRSIVYHPSFLADDKDSAIWQRYVCPLISDPSFQGVLLTRKEEWQSRVLARLEDALRILGEETYGAELLTRNALSEIQLLILEHVSSRPAALKNPLPSKERRIKDMLLYIQRHYPDSVTLKDIADAGAVSQSEALRTFRETIGTTPVESLRAYRLQQAAYLLRGSKKSAAQIAEDVGFNDSSYFTKSFREAYGVTPAKYRDAQS